MNKTPKLENKRENLSGVSGGNHPDAFQFHTDTRIPLGYSPKDNTHLEADTDNSVASSDVVVDQTPQVTHNSTVVAQDFVAPPPATKETPPKCPTCDSTDRAFFRGDMNVVEARCYPEAHNPWHDAGVKSISQGPAREETPPRKQQALSCIMSRSDITTEKALGLAFDAGVKFVVAAPQLEFDCNAEFRSTKKVWLMVNDYECPVSHADVKELLITLNWLDAKFSEAAPLPSPDQAEFEAHRTITLPGYPDVKPSPSKEPK